MIIKVDEKETYEYFKKVLDRRVIDNSFSYIYFTEIKEAIMVDHADYFKEFKDELRLVHAYQIIGRAMTLGDCKFLSAGGTFCKLLRGREDFFLSLIRSTTDENELTFSETKDLFEFLIKIL